MNTINTSILVGERSMVVVVAVSDAERHCGVSYRDFGRDLEIRVDGLEVGAMAARSPALSQKKGGPGCS